MKTLKWLFSKFLLLAAVLVVLTLMLVFEENWRGTHAWNAYVREHKARGESLDFKQLAPPPVPDDQNFAMTPLLAPLFQADSRKSDDYADQLKARFSIPVMPGKTQPKLGDSAMGRHLNIPEWKDYLGGDLLEWLKKYDGDLREISGAARRPYARFPLAYEQGNAMPLRHATPLMELAKLYRLRACAELDAGQTDQALEDVETIFRLSDSLKNEPVLVSQLVRITILQHGLQAAWEGLAAHRWTDAQLAILEAHFVNGTLLEGLDRAFHGERASLNISVAQMSGHTSGLAQEDDANQSLKRTLPNGIFRQMQLKTNLYCEQYLFKVVDVPGRRFRLDVIAAGNDYLRQMHGRSFLGLPIFNPYNILTAIAMPAMEAVPQKFAYIQSSTDEALVACALERYRLANGRFPGSLAQLVPKYLNAIPPDVVRGEQPIYRLNSDGTYLLYEKGWDGNDNDGKVIEKLDGKGIDVKKSDWVWSPKPL